MNGLTFHSPVWFWGLLILIPLFALRFRASASRRRRLPGLVSPRLQHQLVSGGSEVQRWIVFLFQCVALAFTITALARPQWGFDEVESEVEGRNLFLAIDTSRSMLANDLRPSRLARAKLAAVDIVKSLPEDRIGLIAFAGRPFLQAPLTVDHEAILEAITQVDTEIIPRGGTNLSAAIDLALETIKEAEVEQSALVIFSDGEALEGESEIEAVKTRAREAALTVISVGVGTSEGAIIPELDERGYPLPGVFIKDETGQVVRSRLDPAALQSVASGGGLYVHLGGSTSLSRVVQQIQSGISTSRKQGESRLRPIERFAWPLSVAVLCLVFAHLTPVIWRRPSRPSGLRTLSSTAPLWILAAWLMTASGSFAEDALFAGHEAFEQREYDEAIQAYEGALAERQTGEDVSRLNMAIGAAAFRKGDFERAAEAYGQALIEPKDSFREHAHYNLGNTLFRQGEAALTIMEKSANPDQLQTLEGPPEQVQQVIEQWEGALEHYESALALNGSNDRAAHNIEVVQKRIEELKKEQEQQQEEQQQQEEEEQEENEEDQSESESEERDDQSEEGDETEQESEQEESDEDQQNGEQDSESNEEGDREESESDGQDEEQPEDPADSDTGDEESSQPETPQGQEPEQPDAPEDGELKANPDQAQPQAPQQMNPQDRQTNPETGYAPSEARQLLEALADETEVRPVLAPSRGENYKNW